MAKPVNSFLIGARELAQQLRVTTAPILKTRTQISAPPKQTGCPINTYKPIFKWGRYRRIVGSRWLPKLRER